MILVIALFSLLLAFHIPVCAIELHTLQDSQKRNDLLRLESSRETFLQLSTESNHSYHYLVRSDSWAGFGNQTTVVVEKGQVISRYFHSWNNSGQKEKAWREIGKTQLSKHQQGFTPITLTAVYDECRFLILSHDSRNGHIDLRVNEKNLLKICTYTPTGCLDDCDEGVIINKIEFKAPSINYIKDTEI
jgi:hypothetical protein